MAIVELSGTVLIVSDIIVWFVLHIGISVALLKVPFSFFEKKNRLFHFYSWEKEGEFWQTYFCVQSWKDKLPDGATLFKMGFKKKYLREITDTYFDEFIVESKRAELNHWLLLVPAPLFFLWNPTWAGWLIIFYALLVNIPFIIIQRYNRARLERIQLRRKEKRVNNKVITIK